MKILPNIRSKSLLVLLICLGASTTLLLANSVVKFWNELSDADAKKQTLNIVSWAPLVKKSQPAVVVITTEAMVEQPALEFPGLPGPFRFFAPPSPEKQRGQGSGFLINKDGYIITNQHVIDGAQKIKVTIGLNPFEYDAQVVGADEALDIALIKIISPEKDPKKQIEWPFLPLGDSDLLELGDPVMALGSPLGLVQSVNTGIISQKQRGGMRPSGRDLYVELIQMQMPINPGNSGGPVLDTAGRVVGVSESILASGQAIAFCVPINIIKTMIPQLLNKGQIDKSFLGVEPKDIAPHEARAMGLALDEKGIEVFRVMPDTPAEKAGLKAGDIILEIDGQKVLDSFNLRLQTAYKGIGQTIVLKILRKKGQRREIKVKLEKRPGQTASVVKPGLEKPSGEKPGTLMMESAGLEISDTPDYVKKELGLNDPKNPGALVVGVAHRSAAEFAGIAPGDVIIEVGGRLINSALQLKDLIDKAPKDSTLTIMTRRANAKRVVLLQKR